MWSGPYGTLVYIDTWLQTKEEGYRRNKRSAAIGRWSILLRGYQTGSEVVIADYVQCNPGWAY